MEKGLFDMLLSAKPIFKNREYLRPSYTPDTLLHRDEQIHQIARILAAPLRGETPSNILVYGKPGTGKTATVTYITKELEKVSDRAPIKVRVVYLNCEIVNTHYRVLAKLSDEFLEDLSQSRGGAFLKHVNLPRRVPRTGWPTDEVYRSFVKALDQERQLAVIILDEVDKLVRKSGDDVLYTLTRMNSELERAKVCVVGISNDLNFMDFLDSRVKSSLGEEEIVFPPYNANQLREILSQRAEMSFVEDVLEPAVIHLCAAYAAREHGDARRALDLLRISGEIAEAEGAEKVVAEHVRKARERIEQDQTVEVIKTLPLQSKMVLYSIALLAERIPRAVTSGALYKAYRELCTQTRTDILTSRRVSDLVSELDTLGIITAELVSKGRHGRTKEIRLNVDPFQVHVALQSDYLFADLRLERVTRLVVRG